MFKGYKQNVPKVTYPSAHNLQENISHPDHVDCMVIIGKQNLKQERVNQIKKMKVNS